MFVEQLSDAIAGAKTYGQFNQLSAAIWKAHGAGLLDDNAAQMAAEGLQARKAFFGCRIAGEYKQRTRSLPRPFKPRSPDKQRSLERRRAVAMSGRVPSRLAAAFTLSELAVLSVVAGEVKRHGACMLHIDAIAALAGCCRTTVQNALRQATCSGLIRVKERRRRGLKSLSNVVTVTSPEWRSWLRLGGRVQKAERHVKQYIPAVDERPIGVDSRKYSCSVLFSETGTGHSQHDRRHTVADSS